MGRKRLLTILAAVTAAITLQVGPAAAATDDCLVLGEDVSLLGLLDLSKTTCVVDKAGKLVQGTLEDPVGTVEKTVEKTVDTVEKTVEKTTEKVTETVTGSGGTSTPKPTPEPEPEPKPSPKPAPESPSGSAGDGASSTGGSTSGGSSSNDVAASGSEVREPQAADPARERQLGALRAIRDDLAASTPADRGIAGPVQPFGDLATTDDLAAPQVADAGEVVPGVTEGRSPQIAPAPASPSQDAVLATSSPMRDIAEAPLALQLLAAALVMGAATVWTIASRELGRGQTTTA